MLAVAQGSCKAGHLHRWENQGLPSTSRQRAVRSPFPEGGTSMTQAMIKTAHRPSWIDLSSNDASGSRAFYSRLFDWKVDVNPDPQYGGYGRATVHGRDAAGITPTQSEDQPTAWNFYIHTDDADETARA